ncbi:MAG TPA: hypothetical protein ENI23_01495 [bacterium]|nr:hypothetical protein [bacterium]
MKVYEVVQTDYQKTVFDDVIEAHRELFIIDSREGSGAYHCQIKNTQGSRYTYQSQIAFYAGLNREEAFNFFTEFLRVRKISNQMLRDLEIDLMFDGVVELL